VITQGGLDMLGLMLCWFHDEQDIKGKYCIVQVPARLIWDGIHPDGILPLVKVRTVGEVAGTQLPNRVD
jgi:hypothetical protein